MVNGVLPYQEIKDMVATGWISHREATTSFLETAMDDQIGPASFEPSLGERIFAMPSSILPCEEKGLSERLKNENLYTFELRRDENRFLYQGSIYVIPLNENLALPDGFIGESTGRSSVGRTNTVLRLLTDTYRRYNFIPSGYQGRIFLEIFPGSFPIILRSGLSLNQIKFAYSGSFEDTKIDEASLMLLHSKEPILYDEKGEPLKLNGRIEKDSVIMSLKLKGDSPLVYRARRNVLQGIDFSRDFRDKKNRYSIDEFWEEIDARDGRIILNPGEFYLMLAKERIAVPPGYVTKMVQHDDNLGDLKTQEADLFNPGHGLNTRGFSPVLEIKPYGQPIELRDGFPICRIIFQRLRSEPICKLYDDNDESYVGQSTVNPGKMFI